jgi:hypothetical protein
MDNKISRLEKRARKREERETYNQHQREQFNKRQRNKRIFNYSIGALILVAIGYAVFVSISPEEPGQYDDFAKCVQASGATMYGTDWCPHCQEQKRLFGSSFRYVTYINCDLNAAACQAAGVEGYPTWVYPQGPPASGTQPLLTIAERTGCTLP